MVQQSRLRGVRREMRGWIRSLRDEVVTDGSSVFSQDPDDACRIWLEEEVARWMQMIVSF